MIQKYDVPGPRYTSYPTVPAWKNLPDLAVWPEKWSYALSNEIKAQAGCSAGAIYVHIPFCESLCTYCGCNTRITRNRTVAAPYVDTILKEWDLVRRNLVEHGALANLQTPYDLAELHLGGGTPTFLTPEELDHLVSGLFQHARLAPDAELSVEADPRVTTRAHLETLARLGFRRLSLGIQDFDPEVQELVNRVQTRDMVARVVDQARELGFTSINFDLIYGLPKQCLESIAYTIRVVEGLRPDRIAFYSYAHVPWIKSGQRKFTEADLPTGATKRSLYELGRMRLESVGYQEIGMDHFALPTDGLARAVQAKTLHRNFMGYIERHVSPLIGLGVSAIGDAWTTFVQNEKTLETYTNKVAAGHLPIFRGHVLTEEDLFFRKHILALMTRFETSWLEKSTASRLLAFAKPALTKLAEDGIIEWSAADGPFVTNHCRVTDFGRPFLRNVCMAFDPTLAGAADPNRPRFSQTI
ncbi:MAG: oxygen-independent coproporphyrinogen III oxidase [Bdellovibrionota bacterium]